MLQILYDKESSYAFKNTAFESLALTLFAKVFNPMSSLLSMLPSVMRCPQVQHQKVINVISSGPTQKVVSDMSS